MSERAYNQSEPAGSDRFCGWPGPDPDAFVPTRALPKPRLAEKLRAGAALTLRWHGDADPNADRAWLVRDLIPETGKGLAAGQWGAGKTFGVLDLGASVMTGQPFAGRKVLREGGVLFIAAEGAHEIPIRLRGIVQGKLGSDAPERLPFAWIEECPRLLDADSVPKLVAVAKLAADHMAEAFDLPLALIVVDTVAAGAGFMDENSAAEAQRVMNALEAISHQTGAFVLGVDHFGKAVETGTRGSSAKEAAADVVLAMLATRDEAGTISNTRMAIRKVRGGRCGYEIPYTLEVITVGETYDREPITTCIVTWQTDRTLAAAITVAKERWPTSLKVFRQALTAALCDHGIRAWPHGSTGAEHRATAVERVRDAFYATYPADGEDGGKRADAKRQAFGRALKMALGRSLVASVELQGVDHLWLVLDAD